MCSVYTKALGQGSPPPTRGTLVSVGITTPFTRITPAYAGNTHFCLFSSTAHWDHPRLRGEHEGRVYKKEVNVGSPPPTRGTLRPKNSAIAGRRITPAYAGNTSKNLLANPDLQDHPRLRGEHDGFKIFYALNVGSPPPTRGTPQSKKFIKAIRGITPAYAGNTISPRLG